MIKLTQEQIKFIDDYLKNSGIEYLDIRYEMTDHVATVLETLEGDFYDNFIAYMLMHKKELLEFNKKAKRTAILRAVKFYFKTMVTSLGFASGMMMFLGVYYTSFFVEDGDVNFLGGCVMLALCFPMLWFGRKNRSISVMRPLALIPSILFNMSQMVGIATYSIDDRALRVIPIRISISVVTSLMIIVMISLYRCRKQYVGKYI